MADSAAEKEKAEAAAEAGRTKVAAAKARAAEETAASAKAAEEKAAAAEKKAAAVKAAAPDEKIDPHLTGYVFLDGRPLLTKDQAKAPKSGKLSSAYTFPSGKGPIDKNGLTGTAPLGSATNVKNGTSKPPERPLQHPTDKYKVKKTVETAMPAATSKILQAIPIQKLAPAEKVKGWENTPDDVEKPPKDQGTRMVIKAVPGALKSKLNGVPPRPAAPPPMPSNEKLHDKTTITMEDDTVKVTFPEKLYKDASGTLVATPMWRVELKCKTWQRPIGVMTETPNAEFKIPDAAAKAAKGELTVRGATVDKEGKCSFWTKWMTVPPPEAAPAEEEAAPSAPSDAAAADAPDAAADAPASPAEPAVSREEFSQLQAQLLMMTAEMGRMQSKLADSEERAKAAEAKLAAQEAAGAAALEAVLAQAAQEAPAPADVTDDGAIYATA